MNKEHWKTIKSYPNYMISDHGRVWSKHGKGKYLKFSTNLQGYYRVSLSKNNRKHMFSVHRLVAAYFVSNPNSNRFDIVNHKDENKHNNYYKNLEWCNSKYNIDYSKNRHFYRSHQPKQSKKVVLAKNDKRYVFSSQSAAARFLHCRQQTICRCLHNNWKCKGYYLF